MKLSWHHFQHDTRTSLLLRRDIQKVSALISPLETVKVGGMVIWPCLSVWHPAYSPDLSYLKWCSLWSMTSITFPPVSSCARANGLLIHDHTIIMSLFDLLGFTTACHDGTILISSFSFTLPNSSYHISTSDISIKTALNGTLCTFKKNQPYYWLSSWGLFLFVYWVSIQLCL